jgi:hypothetical protein
MMNVKELTVYRKAYRQAMQKGTLMNRTRLAAVFLLFAAAFPALSAEVRGTTQAVSIEDAVVMDGAMTDPRWAKAPELPLGDCDSTNAARYATWAKLLFSPTHLYVGFHGEEPDTAGMPAKAEQRDGDVWQDDSVEVFLRPDPDRPYYQVVVNARGVFGDSMVRDGRWNGSIEAKTRIVAGKHWRAELKIALADIGCYVGGDQAWRVNFNRTRLGRGADATMECSWAVMGGRQYHAPAQFGYVRGIAIPSRPDGVTRTREMPVKPEAEPPPVSATCLYRFEAGGTRAPLAVTSGQPAVLPLYVADLDQVRISLRAKAAKQTECGLSLRLVDGTKWTHDVPVGPDGERKTFAVPPLKQGATDLILSSPAPLTVHEVVVERGGGPR